jgi:glucokinase
LKIKKTEPPQRHNLRYNHACVFAPLHLKIELFMTHILAIDFGGTRIRAAWYDAHLRQIARDETPTRVSDGQSAVLDRIIALAKHIMPTGETPVAIGAAAPGPLDPQRGVIMHAKTLPGWANVPLANILAVALGAPAFIENDANLAALAEHERGAGRDTNPMLYMTLSTGIGGGAIINGSIFTGWSGLAIEPGHQQVILPDGSIQRLEDVASGTGLAKTARRYLAQNAYPDSSLRHLPPENITGEAVGLAAQQGDKLAQHILQEAAHFLGLGMVNLLHLFSPQAIVLGGSVSKLGDLLWLPVQKTITERVLDSAFVPPNLLRPAYFGEDVCLLGAALYAMQRQKSLSVQNP